MMADAVVYSFSNNAGIDPNAHRQDTYHSRIDCGRASALLAPSRGGTCQDMEQGRLRLPQLPHVRPHLGESATH